MVKQHLNASDLSDVRQRPIPETSESDKHKHFMQLFSHLTPTGCNMNAFKWRPFEHPSFKHLPFDAARQNFRLVCFKRTLTFNNVKKQNVNSALLSDQEHQKISQKIFPNFVLSRLDLTCTHL